MKVMKPSMLVLLSVLTFSQAVSNSRGSCVLKIPGMKSSKLLITETTEPLMVTIETGDADCLLTIVAIGGGGGDNMGAMAGGGSGYVEWTQRTVSERMELEVTVGNGTSYNYWAPCCGCGARAGASAVIWWEGSEVLLVANPGGDPHGTEPGEDWHGGYGGDGYSGGGGKIDGAGNGGMDGTDGTGVGGGKGQGIRLEDIPVKQTVLTPGFGGCNGSGGRAGGGGGVVIDGEVPYDPNNKGHPESPDYPGLADCRDKWARNGEGFGAGGFGYGNTALPGAVLFEIETVVQRYGAPVEEAPSVNMICSNTPW